MGTYSLEFGGHDLYHIYMLESEKEPWSADSLLYLLTTLLAQEYKLEIYFWAIDLLVHDSSVTGYVIFPL